MKTFYLLILLVCNDGTPQECRPVQLKYTRFDNLQECAAELVRITKTLPKAYEYKYMCIKEEAEI